MQWLLPTAICMLLVLLGETYGAVTPSSSIINVSQSSSIVPAITSLAASTAPSFVLAPQPTSTIDTNGFSDDTRDNQKQESWLQQHSRWVFVLVIGLLVGAIILWYIVRGITRARRELRAENEKLASGPMHMGSTPPKYEEATSGR